MPKTEADYQPQQPFDITIHCEPGVGYISAVTRPGKGEVFKGTYHRFPTKAMIQALSAVAMMKA